jgi:hypothetical protein
MTGFAALPRTALDVLLQAVAARAPKTLIDSIRPNLTNDTDIVFDFSASEPSSAFEYSLDGASPTTCPPASYLDLDPGTHTSRVWATDEAASVGSTPTAHTWTIDDAAGCARDRVVS